MSGADVVVLGSGAAGLVAAIAAHDAGARVTILEKGDVVGGTTALSGGAVWVPGNHRQAEAGIEDSIEDGFRYLMSLAHGLVEERLVRTLVETGPRVIERLEQVTPLRFRVVPGFPDYQSEHPGSMPGGGRSLEAELYPFAELGPWADRVARPPRLLDLHLHETPTGGGSGIVADDVRAARAERDERGIGQALVGGLLRACLDRGIEPRLGARARRLLLEDGRVTGVELESGEAVPAGRAVVLATGGFEFDAELVRSFLRGPMAHPPGIDTNTGDGLRMAMRVGAALGNMREAWWVPVIRIPCETGEGMRSQLVLRERTLPGSIMVNRRGERFTDEAANYNALGSAFHAFEPTSFDYPNVPAWLVVDDAYLCRYGLGPHPAGTEPPGWVTSRATLPELAGAIGVDPEGLVATVATFNADVAAGEDTRFRRGDSAHDRWAGDRAREGRARTLGPLDTPPFHAVEVHSSCLGTNGGPRTDEHARVLDVDGEVIAGLYAAGNVMAGVTGMTYGGAGGTLGPAMTFGWIAGDSAARDQG